MGAEMAITGSDTNEYAQYVAEAGGVSKLEALNDHPNKEVFNRALRILDTYFYEDDTDDVYAPETAANGMFQFDGNYQPNMQQMQQQQQQQQQQNGFNNAQNGFNNAQNAPNFKFQFDNLQ